MCWRMPFPLFKQDGAMEVNTLARPHARMVFAVAFFVSGALWSSSNDRVYENIKMRPADSTILGITVGKHTLSDVTKMNGGAKTWHTGDAGSSQTRLTYEVGDTQHFCYITFISDSEMGGRIQ